MAKKVDPLKAKQAKQKKIAIVLSVLFVAVLAYQVPKTLKMLKGPSAAVATAPAPVPVPVSATPGAAVPATGAPAAAAGAPAESQPAVLIDSDVPVTAGEGQLHSFELFQAQDPFVQQVDPSAVVPAPAGDDAAGSGDAAKTVTMPSLPAGKSGGSIVPAAGAGSTESSSEKPTTAAAKGAPTAVPTPAAATTTIALNGEPVVFAADGSFPADAPTFLLVSTAADGASVEIGIAGGTYADGEETITLKLGKPLTLQNTADGSRYELELLTVAGFAPPKPAK